MNDDENIWTLLTQALEADLAGNEYAALLLYRRFANLALPSVPPKFWFAFAENDVVVF